jgi:hypothetical protein
MTKSWTGHEICPVTDYVNLWPPSVTLTLEVGDRLLRMTHLLTIVSNCGKYLQNPFKDNKVMDRTRHIPSNRQCWPWMSKCDLDSGGRGLVVSHDTSSYDNKHLCQVISDSFNNDKVMDRTRKCYRRTDRRIEPISISPFFIRKGGGQKLCINVIIFAGLQSTRVLPVICLDRPGLCLGQPGSSGVIRERPGKHRHEPLLHLGSAWTVLSTSCVVSWELP